MLMLVASAAAGGIGLQNVGILKQSIKIVVAIFYIFFFRMSDFCLSKYVIASVFFVLIQKKKIMFYKAFQMPLVN